MKKLTVIITFAILFGISTIAFAGDYNVNIHGSWNGGYASLVKCEKNGSCGSLNLTDLGCPSAPNGANFYHYHGKIEEIEKTLNQGGKIKFNDQIMDNVFCTIN